MTERTIPDFNIDQIARSGQCFRFRPLGEGHYALVAGGRYIEISQQGQTVRFDCPEDEFETVWRPCWLRRPRQSGRQRSRRGGGLRQHPECAGGPCGPCPPHRRLSIIAQPVQKSKLFFRVPGNSSEADQTVFTGPFGCDMIIQKPADAGHGTG